jgi:exonuclease III
MGYEDTGYRDTKRQGYMHGDSYTSWDKRHELGYNEGHGD